MSGASWRGRSGPMGGSSCEPSIGADCVAVCAVGETPLRARGSTSGVFRQCDGGGGQPPSRSGRCEHGLGAVPSLAPPTVRGGGPTRIGGGGGPPRQWQGSPSWSGQLGACAIRPGLNRVTAHAREGDGHGTHRLRGRLRRARLGAASMAGRRPGAGPPGPEGFELGLSSLRLPGLSAAAIMADAAMTLSGSAAQEIAPGARCRRRR